jgi:hypothetical protein
VPLDLRQDTSEWGVLTELGRFGCVGDECLDDSSGTLPDQSFPVIEPRQRAPMRSAHPRDVRASPFERSIRILHDTPRDRRVQPQALALFPGWTCPAQRIDLASVESTMDALAVVAERPASAEIHDVLPRCPQDLRSRAGSNELAHAWRILHETPKTQRAGTTSGATCLTGTSPSTF